MINGIAHITHTYINLANILHIHNTSDLLELDQTLKKLSDDLTKLNDLEESLDSGGGGG